ncbi:MAG: protein kinase [Sandaracinaceae bacterium]
MQHPERIGPFWVVQPIGPGATGITYLAVTDVSEASPPLIVCVKVPHSRWAADPRFRAAFENEARIASLLDHPNIVPLRRIGRDEHGRPYLAYRYVEGMDLSELLLAMNVSGEQLGWPLVLTIATQVASALEYAHQSQSEGLRPRPAVIHRDIAPANILLGKSGVASVIDFGLARAAEEASLKPSMLGRGRLAYMAPERLGAGQRYDARADLFSLGALLFEALTGRPPFLGASIAEHVEQVLGVHRPRVEDLRYEFHLDAPVPEGLIRLVATVRRLMDPSPDARFSSAGELVDALYRVPLPDGVHPGDVRRELGAVVRERQPRWRQEIRWKTGQQPTYRRSEDDGARTGDSVRAAEDDSLRVSWPDAERLLEATRSLREGPAAPPRRSNASAPPSSRAFWLLGSALALLAVALACGVGIMGAAGAALELEQSPRGHPPSSTETDFAFTWIGTHAPALVDVNGDGYRDAIGFSWDPDNEYAVAAVSGADASVLWVHSAEQDWSGDFADVFVAVPTFAHVVIVDLQGRVIDLDAFSGRERWRTDLGALGLRTCLLDPTRLALTTTDRSTYRIALSDGTHTRMPAPDGCEAIPIVGENRSQLSHPMPGYDRVSPDAGLPWPREQVAGSWRSPDADHYVVELRLPGQRERLVPHVAVLDGDGRVRWVGPAAASPEMAQSWGLRHVAVQDDTLFVVYDTLGGDAAPRRVSAFALETGQRAWDTPLEGAGSFDLLRADDRRVYVGHWALEVLDRQDGRHIGRVGVFPGER